ncbi:MAG: hypothetical protein NC833_02785 [Candidatus Omnitrophica bacterium]|nr:hypothetical protein [Candidatus Omnitrophota bacterium]
MKKMIIMLNLIVFLSYGEVKKASIEEVKNSIKLIEDIIKKGEDNIIDLFSETIEIEKRATTQYYAEKIKEKICKTSNINENEFRNLRENFSFFDISIAWAINQIKGIPIKEVLKEKKEKLWIEILNEIDINKENLIEKIKELNPKLKTF